MRLSTKSIRGWKVDEVGTGNDALSGVDSGFATLEDGILDSLLLLSETTRRCVKIGSLSGDLTGDTNALAALMFCVVSENDGSCVSEWCRLMFVVV